MNRITPQSIPSPRRIVPAMLAAVILLAMLPLLTRGADAVAGPTIDVTIEDSYPTTIDEPGRKAAFGIAVTNTSPVPVTVTAATEYLDGSSESDISFVHGNIISTTCTGLAAGADIAAGATYECSFIVFVGGDVGDVRTETVTVTVEDGGGATTSDQDQRSYTILDALPTVDVSKSANVSSVTEPGANVTYTATATNTSPEPVTITAATESLDGGPANDLSTVNGPILQTTCGDAVGTVLDPDDTYSCNFMVYVGGDVGDVNTDTVTFTVEEDEGNSTSGQAAKTFTILDGSPSAVWGVTSSDRIYSYTGSGWQKKSGRLVQLDVGNQGEVWGVTSTGLVYRLAGGTTWTRMPGVLKQISVGSNPDGSTAVWCVTSAGYVYRFDASKWTRIHGVLDKIDVGVGEVWGVTSSDRIYRRVGNGNWTNVAGRLDHVSAGT